MIEDTAIMFEETYAKYKSIILEFVVLVYSMKFGYTRFQIFQVW